jgi:hypothetical protein
MRYVGSLCVWHAAANVRAARQVPWRLATSVHQADIDYGAWSSRGGNPHAYPPLGSVLRAGAVYFRWRPKRSFCTRIIPANAVRSIGRDASHSSRWCQARICLMLMESGKLSRCLWVLMIPISLGQGFFDTLSFGGPKTLVDREGLLQIFGTSVRVFF